MPVERYRRTLASPALRQALLLGMLVRTPIFAGGVVLTLHVVASLGRSYGAAGLASAAMTLAIAVSGPWRGRLLDRLGLRRVVLPSIVVAAACWSVAPFVGYWWLVGLAVLAGLFVIPTFSIIRQAVIAAVPEGDRRTALSLDSVAVELSFMAGPALAVWATTIWPTAWVLFTVEMVGVAFGVLLWIVDPPLQETADPAAAASAEPAPLPRSAWMGAAFVAVCLAATATTVVLGGSDIGIVAALRAFGEQASIGWVLAVWGLGSLLGGLVYGGLHRSISAFWLLGALGVVTLPMALASGTWSLAALAFVAGLLCAPTITATIDQMSRIVPDSARGEAMGWHGSCMTAGMALGAPLAGVAIDTSGWPAGFALVAASGIVVAGIGSAVGSRSAHRAPAAQDPTGQTETVRT